MIWAYMRTFLMWLVRMLAPPPKGLSERINPNRMICPACGNRGANLKFLRLDKDQPGVACRCDTCSFAWMVNPVSNCDKPLN